MIAPEEPYDKKAKEVDQLINNTMQYYTYRPILADKYR